ncbi:uncharacterized protein RHIMIDRAFT_252896 [Rhizopus microsporus ATCC 52813]|uniref:Uncharacterized protein n=1 Tax=Rhizopus microsporus ATCC 52813 TaxID=1340429 RepID=A0A2G4T7R2_RHIZD|nr:uncharacterized protein RHIMIDRAFT_252896 [Rhizopus microsporus ATCC 52813]PHZ17062.1 hypothetical protein RHIMIDRAFT_252896 [Rhizopus microsporus ATCC 52813]
MGLCLVLYKQNIYEVPRLNVGNGQQAKQSTGGSYSISDKDTEHLRNNAKPTAFIYQDLRQAHEYQDKEELRRNIGQLRRYIICRFYTSKEVYRETKISTFKAIDFLTIPVTWGKMNQVKKKVCFGYRKSRKDSKRKKIQL